MTLRPASGTAASTRPDPTADLRGLRTRIDARLAALAPGDAATPLGRAIRHALLAPGKRLRPLLLLLACRELGSGEPRGLDAACSLEMIHAASLVLDDLPCMDDAAWRRGQPAVHVAFGESTAILAAVSLLSGAFQTIADGKLGASVSRQMVAILTRAVGPQGLSGGQETDLLPRPMPTVGDLLETNGRKTGALFAAAVAMAAALCEAGPSEARRLDGFAREFGLAFQLLDDLDDRPVGPGGEAASGRATLVDVLGRDGSRRRLAGHVSAALAALRPEGELATFVRTVFDRASDSPTRRVERVL